MQGGVQPAKNVKLKVYMPQEALLVSAVLVSRQINAIR